MPRGRKVLVARTEGLLNRQVLVTIPAAAPMLEQAFDIVRGGIGAAPDAVGLLVGPTDLVGVDELAAMPHLEVVAVAGAGTDAVDQEALKARRIQLLNAPIATVEPTAELTICLALMVSRGVDRAGKDLADGSWTGWSFDHVVGRGLRGLTLGLVGHGRIGTRVGELAEAFGMNVLHHTRRDTQLKGYVPDLPSILNQVDILSLHVPLTPETTGLMGCEEFRLMRAGSALLNTSRGGVVDERALVDSLASGHLSGAALDVFSAEPGIPTDLMDVPNLVLSPHIGTATEDARGAMVQEAAEGLLRVLGRAASGPRASS